MNKVILASGSPRRLEILTMAGYSCTVAKPDTDESTGNMPPDECVAVLSQRKALAVAAEHDGTVIAADTVVALENEILGKPHSEENAYRMLRRLSGRDHFVYTGFTVCRGEVSKTEVCRTKVIMREISNAGIEEYVRSGDPLDKAGAYGIQGAAGMFISAIEGDYYTVMGLPLCRISQILEKTFGIVPDLNNRV